MKLSIGYLTFIKFLYIGTLFISSSFAFFSDSVLNENNRITLGNLRASVLFSNALNEDNTLADPIIDLKATTTPVMNFTGEVEPGDYIEGFFRIGNTGSIALDYYFFFDVIENLNNFSSIIQLDVQNLSNVSMTQSFVGDEIPTLIEGNDLLSNEFELYRVRFSILTSATDEFNNPDLSFLFNTAFTLYAWQSNFPDSRPSSL